VKLGERIQLALTQCSPKLLGEAYGKSDVFEWHKQYRNGRKNVEDDERSGRSRSHRTDEDAEKVLNLVQSDRLLNIKAMAVQLNLDKETVKRA
jgi:hypothetical protein